MKEKIFKENFAKNFIILVCLVIFYFPLKDFLLQLSLNKYDSIITVTSLLIVAFLFGDYTFTYASSNLRNIRERMLDHTITAVIMFGTGALLEISILSLNLRLQTEFKLLEILAFLFYLSLVLYDFWDLNRGLKNYN